MEWDIPKISHFLSARECDSHRREDIIQFFAAFLMYIKSGDVITTPYCRIAKLSDDLISITGVLEPDQVFDTFQNTRLLPPDIK